jgi:hypothetical protein
MKMRLAPVVANQASDSSNKMILYGREKRVADASQR